MVFAFALAMVFFWRPIARGVVLFNRYILRRDISAEQASLERRIRLAGWAGLVVFGAWLLFELIPLIHKS